MLDVLQATSTGVATLGEPLDVEVGHRKVKGRKR